MTARVALTAAQQIAQVFPDTDVELPLIADVPSTYLAFIRVMTAGNAILKASGDDLVEGDSRVLLAGAKVYVFAIVDAEWVEKASILDFTGAIELLSMVTAGLTANNSVLSADIANTSSAPELSVFNNGTNFCGVFGGPDKTQSPYGSRADAAWNRLTGDISIQTWVRLKTYGSGKATIVIKFDGSNYPYFLSVLNTGLLQSEESGGPTVTSTTLIPLNKWVNIAFTRNGTTGVRKLFLNGVVIGTDTSMSFPSAGTGELEIGNAHALDNYAFQGDIADFAIYSSCLDEETILANVTTAPATNAAGIQAYWKFVNGSGDSVVDHAPGGRNLTLNQNYGWTTRDPY